jgi:competence ComEA-like helix-hairpin-helix protein
MNFKWFSSYFSFSKSQRSGLLILLVLIVVLQTIYFFVDFSLPIKNNPEKDTWLSVQSEIDSLKEQARFSGSRLYPFNPNYISDYKGYKLGMSVQEIDRLLAFRKQNRFVNSPKEFQNVTGISDSLLKTMVSYFKFPDWVNKKKKYTSNLAFGNSPFSKKKISNIQDINTADSSDLEKIFGIGELTAKRILSYKDRFGAFVSMEQLNEVWGLSAEVVESLQEHFEIQTQTGIKKLDINNASLNELAQFPYFKYALAKQIVIYRSMNGPIVETTDLTKIKGMPNDKIKIIALYLDF